MVVPRPSSARSRFFRPFLETLEDRMAPAIFTVSNTNDAGLGSLRQAILNANGAAGTDEIRFSIGGGGVQTIRPTSALPNVEQPTIIDGTTQPGYAGTPLIELDGSLAGASAVGLSIAGGNSIVRGLVVNRFDATGISVFWGGGNLIAGNFLGTDPTGTQARPNRYTGIIVYSDNNTIGGTTPADRNVISGNDYVGLQFYGTFATGNRVQGNFIGTDATGTTALGNAWLGVRIDGGAQNNTVGGTAAGAGNRIAYNPRGGVIVADEGTVGNTIRANSIHHNGGQGIDLGDDGVTANHPGGSATGPNRWQNYPEIATATAGSSTMVSGTFNGLPSTTFTLDFYASTEPNGSYYGAGERWLGSTSVTTNAAGNGIFNVNLAAATSNGEWLSATATDPAGNTSEFAASRLLPAQPFATNLQLVQARLATRSGQVLNEAVIGQEVYIRVDWLTSLLNTSHFYVVQVTFDGQAMTSTQFIGSPGLNVPGTVLLGGWYASPGPHTIQVIVDRDNGVIEAYETDNATTFSLTPVAPSTLPSKFLTPLAGVPLHDWTFINYVDVDPQPGPYRDLTGGGWTYDGHTGYDITLTNFARQDAGVPIYAAAAGVVKYKSEGDFDRQTTPSLTNPGNWVILDHGNGWTTGYFHMATNTITVQVGDTVQAGQFLGLVGSSGYSSGPHLHFEVDYYDAPVETYYALGSYWVDPQPFQLTLEPQIMKSGLSIEIPGGSVIEQPPEVKVYPTSVDWTTLFWFYTSHVRTSDVLEVSWFRPDGSVEYTSSYSPTLLTRGGWWNWSLSPTARSAFPGTWQVALKVNGVEQARESFVVTTGAGVPDVVVDQEGTYVLDERTTPIDFGEVVLGGTAPQRVFTISNSSATTLTLGSPVLPPGFSLVGAFPANVAPEGTATFTVRLDTTRAGTKFGQLRFDTNDPDIGTFNFNLAGTVTGAAPVGAPVLTLPGPARGYLAGQAPQVLDAQATLTDSDSANFNTGTLTAEFASGGKAGDQLALRNQGTGPGQVGVSGANVTFGGVLIGTASGGSQPTPLVITFNASATPAAVQAVLRNLTYMSTSASPSTAARYVRLTVVDETGKQSNQPIKVAVVSPAPSLTVSAFTPTPTGFVADFNQSIDPSVLNLYDTQSAGLGLADVTLAGPGGNVRGSLVIASSNKQITFLATGGTLAPGSYTATLRSAANAFRTASGNLLDGNGDGTAGDAFSFSFTVSAPSGVTVSVPDIMRGPGQSFTVPLRLSNGSGVQTVSLRLAYDPQLLTITSATRAAGTPGDAQVTLTPISSGVVQLTYSSMTALAGGARDLITLQTSVPLTASYTAKHVLDLQDITINGGTIGAVADDGLHIAGYFGETSGGGTYGSGDATRALRVAIGLDSGFEQYRLADPRLVADITGNGRTDSTDATRILQEAVGLDRAEIPPLPPSPPLIVIPGPDPLLSIPRNLQGRPGDTLVVPVNLDISAGLESVDLAISYDARRLEVVEVGRGSLTEDFDLMLVNRTKGTIRVGLGRTAGAISDRGSGSVLRITFRIRSGAATGRTIINLLEKVGTTTTQLNEGALDLNPDPSNRAGDALDGVVRIGERRTPTSAGGWLAGVGSRVPLQTPLSELVGALLQSRKRT